MKKSARYPGIRVTANGNQLVSYHTETRIADAGVFYPITPSTEGGELYQTVKSIRELAEVTGFGIVQVKSAQRTVRDGANDESVLLLV